MQFRRVSIPTQNTARFAPLADVSQFVDDGFVQLWDDF
jgi:hypothetical protein